MSQHDYIISNDTGANVRSDLNNALGAIATINSGATEPSTTYAYQLWMDTSSNVLKIRNSANSAWYTLPISPVANNTVDINGGTIDGITSLSTANGTDVSLAGVSSTKFFWDASAESLGIGTTSPYANLHVTGTIKVATGNAQGILALGEGNGSINNVGVWRGAANAPTTDGNYLNLGGYEGIVFATGAAAIGSQTERMRIDSSGNVLVGQTTASTSAAGNIFTASGKGYHIVSGDTPLFVDRKSNDGGLVEFRRDQTVVGSIGTNGGNMYLGSPFVGLIFNRVSPYDISPYNTNSPGFIDNVVDLGRSAARFDDIYATNGTIQTSDRNEKQDIEELSEAEQRVAVACKGLMRKYRWKDSVAEKGDDARIHFGIIAQDLQDAFAAEGLDAGRYAMFISTTWWETQTEVPVVEAVEAQDAVYDDEGNLVSEAVEAVEAKEAYTRTDTYESAEEAPEGAVERTRLGVRYPELLAFIIAAI